MRYEYNIHMGHVHLWIRVCTCEEVMYAHL